jgi:hypothetical protein
LTGGDLPPGKDWQALLESSTRGAPQSPWLWTSKSPRHLAAALGQQGQHVRHHTVARLLEELNYSLQANRQTQAGRTHRERDAQCEHRHKQVRVLPKRGQPVVSVETQKKAWIGEVKNAGREWQPRGHPVEVRTQDFVDQQLGQGIPYGVYDLSANPGGVRVGMDHAPAPFAAESLRRWGSRWALRCIPKPKSGG